MRRIRSKRFRFEALEGRAMLAGNVTVDQDGDTLIITGDDQNNFVVIEGTGAAGALTVAGADATTINGGTTVAAFTGVENIIVDLNAGDDTLQVNNVALDDLIITMDQGADVVQLGAFEAFAQGAQAAIDSTDSVGVDGVLVIDTGSGADLVETVRVFGSADWSVILGDSDGTTNNTDGRPENDFFVSLDDQLYVFIASGDVVHFNGGTGDDLVNVNYLTTAGVLVADGVTGNDVISVNGSVFNDNVVLLGGSGFDTVAVDFSRHDDGADAVIEIDGGSEDDFILFARSLVEEGHAIIRGGGGSDDVVIGRYYASAAGNLATGGNTVATVTLDTGSNEDFADIRGNRFEEFFGIFGSGDDDVDFVNNVVSLQGFLDGGAGFDRLTFLGNLVNSFGIFGFESQNNFFAP